MVNVSVVVPPAIDDTRTDCLVQESVVCCVTLTQLEVTALTRSQAPLMLLAALVKFALGHEPACRGTLVTLTVKVHVDGTDRDLQIGDRNRAATRRYRRSRGGVGTGSAHLSVRQLQACRQRVDESDVGERRTGRGVSQREGEYRRSAGGNGDRLKALLRLGGGAVS
jgi:hypothetical protein